MARKGTIKNMGKVKNEMSDARKARKAAKIAPPATASAKTERLRKAALAEINDRLADGKQDHEVPTAKEVANNAAVDASAKGKKAKAPKTPKAPKPTKEPKAKRVSALDAAAQVLAASQVPMRAKEMIAAMEAKLADSEAKRAAAERSALEDRAYGSVRESLWKAGVPAGTATGRR